MATVPEPKPIAYRRNDDARTVWGRDGWSGVGGKGKMMQGLYGVGMWVGNGWLVCVGGERG